MRTISKKEYQSVLLTQLDYLNQKEEVHPEDLESIVAAYEDSKTANFERVEVIENNGTFTFKPIFLE